MSAMAQAGFFDRAGWRRAADWLIVAAAASLPWSTSATGILVVLWLIVLLPTIDRPALRDIARRPAAILPVALVVLAMAGMLWADVGVIQRAKGLEPLLKLLPIPLLFLQFRSSERGLHVFGAYLVSCIVLLLTSYVFCLLPGQDSSSVFFGVPVKNAPTQSGEFVTCIYGLAFLLKGALGRRSWLTAAPLLVLILAMLGNIVFIATGRTAYAVALILLVVFAMTQLRARSALMLFAVVAAFVVLAWFSSPYLRHRTIQIWTDFRSYEATDVRNSSGERIEFWKKSFEFMREAPAIGHGTGTIAELFAQSAVGKTGADGVASTNPHNQTFVIGIQLGLVGVMVLWAMWVAHLLLFRGEGLAAWVGLLIVVQNVVGSLFNSHLSDFVQGWVYVIGVGVAGGLMLRRRPLNGSS
jgi:O-antigen ligase